MKSWKGGDNELVLENCISWPSLFRPYQCLGEPNNVFACHCGHLIVTLPRCCSFKQ